MNKIRLGEAVTEGWNLYTKNFGLLLLATLLVMVVSVVTCGIAQAPLLAGLFALLPRLSGGAAPRPTAGDVFNGFSRFKQPFLLYLVVFGLLCLLSMLTMCLAFGIVQALVVQLVAAPAYIWSLMLVTYRDMTWSEALGTTFKALRQGEFWGQILLGIVAAALGTMGMALFCIGAILTLPLVVCIYKAGFDQVYGGGERAVC